MLVEDSGVGPRLGTFFLGSTSAHPDDGTGELVSKIQIHWLCFGVHFGGLVFREGSYIAPKNSVGALRAMRAMIDAVGQCAGLTRQQILQVILTYPYTGMEYQHCRDMTMPPWDDCD